MVNPSKERRTMKYLATNTENEAKAIAHRVAFERGEHRQRLYALERRQKVLRVPTEDEDKLPANAVLMTADDFANHVTTEDMIDALPALPAEGQVVEKDQVYNYNGQALVAYQNHTRTHHDPLTVPALFGTAKGKADPWKQPTGGHNAYNIGDVVTYQGKTWVCVAGDASGKNSWAPGVYGWEEQS
jgi:hypothetical protein